MSGKPEILFMRYWHGSSFGKLDGSINLEVHIRKTGHVCHMTQGIFHFEENPEKFAHGSRFSRKDKN